MKKLLYFAGTLLIISSLCGCGKQNSYDYTNSYPAGSLDSEQLEFSGTPLSVTPFPITSTPTPEPHSFDESSGVEVLPLVTPIPLINSSPSTDALQQTSNQLPIQSPSPIQTAQSQQPAILSADPTADPTLITSDTIVNEVRITKSPTSETVYAGGSALFIAKAENATSTNWILVSPDAKTSYRIQDAASHFSGLTVDGQGTSNLRLSNIPSSMSGWRVQCYFNGAGGPKYTNGAYVTVLMGASSSSTPSSGTGGTESMVSTLAVTTGQNLYSKAIGYGYSNVTDIMNYSFSGNQATYSMEFRNANYRIVGQFRSYYNSTTENGSEPLYAYVYDSAGASKRADNMSGQSFDYFYSILDQFK